MRKIKVQMLTREAFAPFGKVLDLDDIEPSGGSPETHMWYPQVAIVDKATSLNWMEVFPREFTAQKFEAHDYTCENLIPMTGGIIVTCMPAGPIDVEKLAAFYIPQGKGVSFDPSVWHFVPYPIGETVKVAVVFANGTSSNDIYFDELPEVVGLEL